MTLKKQHIGERIDIVLDYLEPLLDFANCHMVSFITENLWAQFIPKDVAREIDAHGIGDSIDYFWNIIDKVSQNDFVDEEDDRFANLKTYIRTASQHSLQPDGLVCLSMEQFEVKLQSLGVIKQPTDNIQEFMSKKKSHEVQRISHTISRLFRATGCTHCLDVGGGKGYLAQHLASYFHHPAFSVDCSEITLEGAARRRDKLKKVRPETISKSAPYHHIQQFVSPETDLVKMIADYCPLDADNCNLRICLTGLHTCGDLGPASLKLFCGNPAVRSLCNVPCCYHLLTETNPVAGECDSVPGFPMSKYLTGQRIGRNARMLASQSIERVVSERKLPELSLHYRAMLQVLIESLAPNGTPETNGKLRKIASKCENFSSYVQCAISKLSLNFIQKSDVELETLEQQMSIHQDRMNMFYLLRLCLAQTVESLILLDRLMFLAEAGGDDSQCFLVKMFDAVVSPRCYALVAVKDF